MLVHLNTHTHVDTDVKCQQCGVLIVVEVAAHLKTRKFCNRECAALHRAPGKPRLSRQASAKYDAWEAFHDACAICGWAEETCDVCHIVPIKEGGEDTVDNVVILCPNHHRLFDRGRISIVEVLQAREQSLKLAD